MDEAGRHHALRRGKEAMTVPGGIAWLWRTPCRSTLTQFALRFERTKDSPSGRVYKECFDETELHQHADNSFPPDDARGD